MLFYIFTFIGTLISFTLGLTVGTRFFGITEGQVFRVGFFAIVFLLVIDAAVALIVRAMPKKLMNPYLKRFKVFSWESKVLVALGVRKWKDKIPEAGGTLVGFSKREVKDKSNPEYLYQFMVETVYGEVMHFWGFIFSFLVFAYKPAQFWIVYLPLFLTNFLINFLPVMVQRYNRPKLMKAYERATRKLG